MRLGSFIAGAMVGAAVVMCCCKSDNRNRLKSIMGGVSDTLKEMGSSQGACKTTNTSHESHSQHCGGQKSQSSSHSDEHSQTQEHSQGGQTQSEMEGFRKVKDMISKDPQLKKVVSEIMKTNSSSHSTSH
ncbi:hypothetical protein NV379_06590 [Paenibacillus sp. N1-5-1-14]|uniref:hypothetical protein n=1 Tax=Paenibacillus radicibacter TaxID=2972488 RepID=UPI002158F15F|nr:hypothetical protein [Paenibacillus radicibacter]MCR8642325.1 hypothetical protein [Paenibacillus radicibacter]